MDERGFEMRDKTEIMFSLCCGAKVCSAALVLLAQDGALGAPPHLAHSELRPIGVVSPSVISETDVRKVNSRAEAKTLENARKDRFGRGSVRLVRGEVMRPNGIAATIRRLAKKKRKALKSL